MNSTIFWAGAVLLFLRVSPVFIPQIKLIRTYPRLNRYLDWVVFLITGEIIYTMSMGGLAPHDPMMWVNGLALVVTVAIMRWSGQLSHGLMAGLSVFFLGYALQGF